MSTVQVTEDQTYVFGSADFGSGYYAVSISSLPTTGTLELNGVPVKVGKVVYASQITAGDLVFVPNTDVSAAGSFNFKALNTTGGTIFSGNVALGVTPDAGPTASASSVQVSENQTYTFRTADFGYSDTLDKTADPLGSVKIASLPANGTLYHNGTALTTANLSTLGAVSAADITGGNLTFVPTTGSTTTGSFNFQVTDSLGGTTSANAAAMTLNIASTAGPAALASSVSLTEDHTYTFKTTDFGYSDSPDTTDPLGSVTITSLPGDGTLYYQTTALTTANLSTFGTVSAADITSGYLTFVPNPDVTTQGSFFFQVTDKNDGSTSLTAAKMTLNISADTAPTAGSSTVGLTEDHTYTFKSTDFVYSDSGDTGDPLGSVVITSLPGDGTLYYKTTALTTANLSTLGTVSAADITSGYLTFVPNTDVTTQGSFQFKVTDTATGGTSNTSTAATMTLNIAADTAPTAGASSVNLTEDHAYTFKSTDFVYSDSGDTGDPLGSVVITSLPGDGTLYYKTTALTTANLSTLGTVSAADITSGYLTFVPNTDVTTQGSFQFKVTDTATGGTSNTSAAATMTLNISADTAPTTGTSSIGVTENQTYIFKTTDFAYSDSADSPPDQLGSVIITSLPGDGTLYHNGTALTTANLSTFGTVSAADITGGNLTFVPTTGSTTAGTFNFEVTDSIGKTASAAAPMNITITAVGPAALASSVSLTEDHTYTFKTTDFGYSDSPDTTDPLGSVTITSLPGDGTLYYQTTALTTANLSTFGTVSAADITSGYLTFVPNPDVTTQGSFFFQVTDKNDGSTSLTAAKMTLNISADTAPTAGSSTVGLTEDHTYTFKSTDFVYSDSGDTGDPLGSVVITSLPGDGTLYYKTTALTTANLSTLGTVSAADITSGYLTFVPNTDVTTQGSFQFKVTDTATGGTSNTSTAATMTLNIAADTAPTAGASSVNLTEDHAYTFKSTDFVYSDSGDTGDPLGSVVITSLPGDGTLYYKTTALTTANLSTLGTVSAADITSGYLTFVPNTDVTTQGSFQFKVTDTATGGTSNTSAAATMTLNISADTAPTTGTSSIGVTENQTYIFKTTDFAYSDSADSPPDQLGSVIITSLPGDGTLYHNGTALTTANLSTFGTVSAADITGGNLTFVPTTGSTTAGTFNFEVTDSIGKTASAAAPMNITITAPAPSNLSFAAQNFNTVGTDNSGYYMIPPDPNAAVGLNTVITATNGVIETFNKSGVLQSNTSLNNFYVAGLGSLVLTNFNDSNQSGPFDPKVIYDPYNNRFIVVALQESDAGGSFNDTNTSNILMAVSSPDTGGALTWKYTSINSDVIANGTNCWADYPGLSVDGSGNLYVTTNLFDHATGNYQGSRLWTISENDILSGAAGTNATASGKASIYDPSVLSGATSAGSSELFTLMPAQMLPGTGAFAKPSGTYLVSYNGASNSQGQVLNVIQVTPQASGGPTFAYQQINLGNIDSAGAFASFTAPQKGTTRLIDADDDRVYSAVFRNGVLYAATTIIPTSSYDSANAGKTTAHWFQINASTSNLSLMQQGDVNGAGIASGLRTYYPSISVDANGDFAIGFSASGPNNYASAYYEAYKYNASSNTWTFDTPTLLAGGVASYYRTFGSGDNRWGDFSSVVPDPSSPSTFWVYNEYAMSQGTTISRESGRWATQVGEFTLPNTTTGAVVAGGSGTGSIQPTGSGSPSTATPGSAQLAQSDHYSHRQTSDINASANPLVESDHGPSIAFLPSDGHHLDGFSSQIAGSFSQLVQTMAAFGINHEGIPALSGTVPNDPVSPSVLAANLFHHHG